VVRFAQIKLLLENGLAPERIIFELMPLDAAIFGRQPLDTIHVTERGAVTYRPRLPAGPAGCAVAHSRLALTAWARTGRHYGNPAFRPDDINRGADAAMLADLRTVYGNLARVARAHGVPVTVVLIPTYEQVVRGMPF